MFLPFGRFFSVLFCCIAAFGFLASATVWAQSNSSFPLTPPKRVKMSDLPSVESTLVYPEDGPNGRVDRPVSQGGARRYNATPSPENIGSDSVIRTAVVRSDEVKEPGRIGQARSPRLPGSVLQQKQHTAEGILVNYTTQSEGQGQETDPNRPAVRTASFLNIIPGVSHVDEVIENWGEPLRRSKIGEQVAHFYSTEILNHIEVLYKNGIVSSIVVRLDTPFPEEQVRDVLKTELLQSKPVLVPNETGTIVGEVFPEKGVLFLFSDSETPSVFLVRQIAIEPVTSEPFVLRAEATITSQPYEARLDLVHAININPNDAKAFWLLARIELMEGNAETSMLYCEKAIKNDERRPAYHLALAQALVKMNRFEEAKLYLEETLAICDRYPHEKARILCLLGDLYRLGNKPDYETAIDCHSDAIRLASSLIEHSNPTIRQSAKDVLFEAHLGAARDVAWGRWDEKEESIKKWIDQAKEIAEDPEMISAKRFSMEYPFKLAVCSLACQVGMPDTHDIKAFIEDVVHNGELLIQSTNDPMLIRKYQWETSLALYDAVQIYQLRKKFSQSLRYGELAAEYMEAGIENRRNETDRYLLGRLYFRLGAIHAIGNKNHRAAIEWFDQAKSIFEKLLPKINPEELGRLGETFVSMGVSYWATGQREEAVRLTERGLKQVERAAKLGLADQSAFRIPYSNLANMYEELGNTEKAKRYARLATNIR